MLLVAAGADIDAADHEVLVPEASQIMSVHLT